MFDEELEPCLIHKAFEMQQARFNERKKAESPPKMTPEEEAELIERCIVEYKKGQTIAEVCEITGAALEWTKARMRKAGIIRSRSEVNRMNAVRWQEKRRAAMDAYASGMSVQKTADFVDVSAGTVGKWIKLEGISRSRSEAQQMYQEKFAESKL